MGKPNVEKMKAEKDVEGLIKALEDEDWDVRRKAAEALGEIKNAKAVESLTQALNKKCQGGRVSHSGSEG